MAARNAVEQRWIDSHSVFLRLATGEPLRISTREENVGRHIAGTKKKISWWFSFGPHGAEHTVELYVSMLRGKRAAYVDGALIHKSSANLKGSLPGAVAWHCDWKTPGHDQMLVCMLDPKGKEHSAALGRATRSRS